MGFFDLFRHPEPKKEILELSLNNVEEWLKSKELEITHALTTDLHNIRTKTEDVKTNLLKNLKILETAEIKNQSIPDRAKQIMAGNREIYIQKILSLKEKINLPETPDEVIEFSEDFDKKLEIFEQGIGKSHRIMEEFFLDKAGVISTNIKSIDKLVKDAKSTVKNSKLDALKKTRNEFVSLTTKLNQKENLRKGIEELKEKTKLLSNEVEKNKQNVKKLQESDSYSKAKKLIAEKESLKNQITDSNNQMAHHFSEMETALKKYENLSENKLARKYLESPLIALLSDTGLEIVGILEAIKLAISKNEIILKDKKKDKAARALSILNKDHLENFLETNKKLKETLADLTKKIETEESLKKAEDLKNELEASNKSLEEHKSDLEKTEKELSEINPKDLTNKLEESFLKNLGEEVRIAQ